MGTVIMNPPPDCPDGRWCVICLMLVKQKQWEQYQPEIKAGWEASGEKRTVIPWPPGLTAEIRYGRYRGVSGDAPQLGVLDDLCWDRVAGLGAMPADSPLIPANALPPGLAPRRR